MCYNGIKKDIWINGTKQRIQKYIYNQLIVNKDAKIIQWGKKSFYQMILGQLDISCKGIKLDSPKTKPKMDPKKTTRLKPHKYKTFRGDITHGPELGGDL